MMTEMMFNVYIKSICTQPKKRIYHASWNTGSKVKIAQIDLMIPEIILSCFENYKIKTKTKILPFFFIMCKDHHHYFSRKQGPKTA